MSQETADAIARVLLSIGWAWAAYEAPGPGFYRVAVWFILGYLMDIKSKT